VLEAQAAKLSEIRQAEVEVARIQQQAQVYQQQHHAQQTKKAHYEQQQAQMRYNIVDDDGWHSELQDHHQREETWPQLNDGGVALHRRYLNQQHYHGHTPGSRVSHAEYQAKLSYSQQAMILDRADRAARMESRLEGKSTPYTERNSPAFAAVEALRTRLALIIIRSHDSDSDPVTDP